MGSDESHFNVSLIVRDKVTTRLCPQTTTFLKKKDSWSGIETRPFCFKSAHKPSCRLPLVIPLDNSRKGVGLWMGLCIYKGVKQLVMYAYIQMSKTASHGCIYKWIKQWVTHAYVLRVKQLVMHAYSKGKTASHACEYNWEKKLGVHAYTKGKTASHATNCTRHCTIKNSDQKQNHRTHSQSIQLQQLPSNTCQKSTTHDQHTQSLNAHVIGYCTVHKVAGSNSFVVY